MENKVSTPQLHNWPHHKVALSILWGTLLLVGSLVINYLAGTYATEQAGSAVHDIILDHLPTLDVDGLFVYGIILFFIGLGILLSHKPKKAPFVLRSLSFFIVIRSFFVILTHVGPSPNIMSSSLDRMVHDFTFGGDLFFSAHTGLPFLVALIFWQDKQLRTLFIALSVFFAVVVLVGHYHYSIDVFAAYFITYGIYQMATKLFKKEFHLFKSHYKPEGI